MCRFLHSGTSCHWSQGYSGCARTFEKRIFPTSDTFPPTEIPALCPRGNFAYCFVVCFFKKKNKFCLKDALSKQSECQADWIQIRPAALSGRIWIQSFCKSYQQTTLGSKELTLYWCGLSRPDAPEI